MLGRLFRGKKYTAPKFRLDFDLLSRTWKFVCVTKN
jgi:hypothetical protein